MTASSPQPCEVCGTPTTSEYGVCHGTEECRREYGRRYHGTKMGPRTSGPCAICGRATVSKFGVCRNGTRECSDEYERWLAISRSGTTTGQVTKRTPGENGWSVSLFPGVTEDWRPLINYEGLYEVSDQGRMKSLPRPRVRRRLIEPRSGGHLLRFTVTPKGYLAITLRHRDGKTRNHKVHRLVAATFLGPPPPGQVVRHGLGGPADNRLANLCYGTPAENLADMVRHRQALRGDPDVALDLTEAEALDVYRRYIGGELPVRLAREYAAVVRHITNLIRNRNPSAAAA